LPVWRDAVRVSPLTEVWHNSIQIISGIEMIIIARFAQRAGRLDQVAAIPR
jgi:hypothetical protein